MTIFEKIIAREIPADLVHEDDICIAFRDTDPKAPVHILIVPKKVIPRIGASEEADIPILGHLLVTSRKIAESEGLLNPGAGYRLVINNGPQGGESVPHLHVHLLGGRQLGWPPG